MDVRQSGDRSIADLGKGHGVETCQGNGNDIIEVAMLATEAVNKARNGEGPILLEFSTYRWREHCGPNFDNDIGYRDEQEYLDWKATCPIQTFRAQLKNEFGVSQNDIDQMENEIEAEITEAFQFAKDSPFPDASEVDRHLYAK